MNPLSFNMPARPEVVFGLLSVAFLCVARLVSGWIPSANAYWLLAIFLILCTVSMRYVKESTQRGEILSAYTWNCLVYGCLVACVGLVHAVGLYTVPGEMPVNAEGLTAFAGLKMDIYFTCVYLFFPAMLFACYMLVRKASIPIIIRWLVLAMTASLGVLLYQKFINHSFLTFPPWNRNSRYGGLASDPNAMSLSIFLLLPLLVAGIFIEKNKRLKIFYSLLVLLLLPAEFFTGNRTASVGVFLFVCTLPSVMAIVHRHWTIRWRVIAGMAPVVMLFLGFLFAPVIVSTLNTMSVTGSRLARTWHVYEREGIKGIFTHGEVRGDFYGLAADMSAKAPWAGWGPGGYYREYSNIIFRRSGIVQKAFDSALNHYLMIAADLGVLVLVVNLVLILSPMLLGVLVFRRLFDIESRLLIAVLVVADGIFCLLIMTIPPSYFLDVLWIWAVELALLLSIADRHDVRMRIPSGNVCRAGLATAVIGMALVVFVGSYETAFGAHGYASRQKLSWWTGDYVKNCYPPARKERGALRWCGKDASLIVRVRKGNLKRKKLVLYVRVSHPDVVSDPVTVAYGPSQGLMQLIRLSDNKWHRISVPVTRKNTVLIRQLNGVHRFLPVSIDVSRTWVPEQIGENRGVRELGVAVSRYVHTDQK